MLHSSIDLIHDSPQSLPIRGAIWGKTKKNHLNLGQRDGGGVGGGGEAPGRQKESVCKLKNQDSKADAGLQGVK